MAALQFHVLLISPTPARQRAVRQALDARALRLFYARHVTAAQACCQQNPIDLILLDYAGDEPLAECCAQLRQVSDAPVLALVAADESRPNTGPATTSGADEILPLPLCPDRLRSSVGRLLSALPTSAEREVFRCGDLIINLAEQSVTRAGQLVRLSRTEWALLADLVLHAGVVRTQAALLNRVWGPTYDGAAAYLHVYVNRLRRKLEPEPARPRYLLTEPGLGYRFTRAAAGAPSADTAEVPPARPPAPLPQPPTPLIGREAELADLSGRLAGGARLITLLGPGGSGKTRLALELGRRVRQAGHDVAFVSLADVSDPALIAGAIAEGAGVAAGGHIDAEGLREALQGRALTLILDNFEQLLVGAAQIGELLTQLPGLQILVTSRAPLRLQAEEVVPVGPLQVPTPGSLPPEKLLRAPALGLFIARARAASPSFVVTPEDAELLAAICAQLDGLPLAIELAAPWVRVLTLAELHVRLQEQLAVLVNGAVDRPSRHQSLRAAIDGSYELITPAQRTLFARLGIFAGGWSLEGAAVVCGTSVSSMGLVSDLAALVDSQLVRAVADARGEHRFTMLETLRTYALERLGEGLDEGEARDRHAAHYRALLAESEGQGDQSEVRLHRLTRERANVRAAMRWLVDRRAPDAAQLVGNLWWFWRDLGHPREGQRWFDELLARPDLSPPERAAALHGRASVAMLLGDYDAAEVFYAESMTLYRALGDETAVARALNNLGYSAMMRGDLGRARGLLESCLATARRLNRPPLLAYALYNLGRALSYLGEPGSDALLSESHAIFCQLDAYVLAARALQARAELALATGQSANAAGLLLEALTAWLPHTDLRCAENMARLVAEVLEASAGVAAARQDWRGAAHLCGAAEAVRRRTERAPAPFERARHQLVVQAARTHLGAAEWPSATGAGAALSPDEVMTYVCELLRAHAVPPPADGTLPCDL